MLYILPIEPLEERYSKQWLQWTCDYVWNNNIEHIVICPDSYGEINTGAFLDVVNTNVFKNAQMQSILQLFKKGQVKDGDIFWFHDMWFPGLEMLAYIRDGLGIDFKIYGMLHAGTYDSHDFLAKKGMRKWGKFLESSWFNIVDGMFVATEFHKRLVKRGSTGLVSKRVHVTGFPMYASRFAMPQRKAHNRDKIIVFPHRLDEEKQPHLFSQLKQEMLEKYPWCRNYQFIKTKEVCKTKEEYFQLLCRAEYAVSFALQETWGIAMQEAVLCGCIPIVPARLSYREMYPYVFQYDGEAVEAAQCIDIIRSDTEVSQYVHGILHDTCVKLKHQGERAFGNMMRIMGVL